MSDVGSGWGNLGESSERGSTRFLHVVTTVPQQYVILSDEIANYYGHFRGGKMVACLGDGCKLCRDGVGKQQRWVFYCFREPDLACGMLEVGRSTALVLRQVCESFGCVRGAKFELWKSGLSKYSSIRARHYSGEIVNDWQGLPIESPKSTMESRLFPKSVPSAQSNRDNARWKQQARLLIDG